MNPNPKESVEPVAEPEYEKYRREKHEKMTTSPEVIGDIVIESLGSPMAGCERIVAGESNEVYCIKTESGNEAIIRISHGKNSKFERERWAFEQCAKVGAKTPSMIWIGSKELETGKIHVCVETKIQGVSLDKVIDATDPEKEPKLRKLLNEVGKTLSRIHSIRTKGFGVLDGNGNGENSSVTEMVLGNKDVIKDDILKHLADRPDDAETIISAYEILTEQVGENESSDPRLVHNDFSPQNMLVHNGQIFVIDFESAQGGNPLIDFALWEAKHGKEYPTEYIQGGYENQELFSGDFQKRLNFWKLHRCLGKLRYCLREKKLKAADKALESIKQAISFLSSPAK
jgi:aminoglycoside phosphotransferase (APT) family kinase protein